MLQYANQEPESNWTSPSNTFMYLYFSYV